MNARTVCRKILSSPPTHLRKQILNMKVLFLTCRYLSSESLKQSFHSHLIGRETEHYHLMKGGFIVLDCVSFNWVYLSAFPMAVSGDFYFVSGRFRGVSSCTCGAWRVDEQSSAPDVDVGSEVPGQRLIWGLGDFVRQSVDALDAAGLRQEINTDTLLSQRRQNLLHGVLQLCKNREAFSSTQCVRALCCAMQHV